MRIFFAIVCLMATQTAFTQAGEPMKTECRPNRVNHIGISYAVGEGDTYRFSNNIQYRVPTKWAENDRLSGTTKLTGQGDTQEEAIEASRQLVVRNFQASKESWKEPEKKCSGKSGTCSKEKFFGRLYGLSIDKMICRRVLQTSDAKESALNLFHSDSMEVPYNPAKLLPEEQVH